MSDSYENSKTVEELTPEQEIAILDEAERLMSVPHTIVRNYVDFVTDEQDLVVSVGDPAACRFCVAGLIDHAATNVLGFNARVRGDAELRMANGPYWRDRFGGDYWTQDESGEYAKDFLNIFDEAWCDAGDADEELDEEGQERVRANVLEEIRAMRERLEA